MGSNKRSGYVRSEGGYEEERMAIKSRVDMRKTGSQRGRWVGDEWEAI